LIQLDSSKGKVKVNYGNQQTIESDFVIVTTSLGVLKANEETLFKPPLPERKRLAIEANYIIRIFINTTKN
jgi:monoamine oxidase